MQLDMFKSSFFLAIWLKIILCVNGQVRFVDLPRMDIEGLYERQSYPGGVKSIDIKANATLLLKCTGHAPMRWTYPNNYLYDTFNIEELAVVEDKCEINGRTQRCTSLFRLSETSYEQTGTYACHYNDTQDATDNSLYVFVNDEVNLLVPYEGNEFIFISVVQSTPTTIPCVPSMSLVDVGLYKVHTQSGLPERIPVDGYFVSYNPTRGFHFSQPQWDSETSSLECVATLNNNTETKIVTIHWSVDPGKLYPLIDDDQAKHPAVNGTFSLTCKVHIDLGVIISMDWGFPDTADSNRIDKEDAKTDRFGIKGNRYDTVSRKITVMDTQLADGGEYVCKVIDAHGRMYTVSQNVSIYDKSLPASIDFSLENFDNSKPLIRNVGKSVQFAITVHAQADLNSVSFIWLKDGTAITEEIRAGVTRHANPMLGQLQDQVHYNGSFVDPQVLLNIDMVTMKDSGVYTLMANLSDGSPAKSINMTLQVQGNPLIEIRSSLAFYRTAGNYSLACQVTAFPKPTVWWRWLACNHHAFQQCHSSSMFGAWSNIDSLGNESVSNGAFVSEESHDERTSVTIKRIQVTARTTGMYACWAENSNGTSLVPSLFVVTDAEDGFSVSSSTDEPVEKSDITLTCEASLFNYTSLAWYKRIGDNESEPLVPVVDNLDDKVSVLINETDTTVRNQLVLKSTTLDSSGNYYCNATSRFEPSVTHAKHFALDVLNVIKPIVNDTNMNGKLITEYEKRGISLKCRASGRPKPKISWYKNEKPLSVDNAVELFDNGQIMVIRRLVVGDSGNYECVVENSGGRLIMSQKLKVVRDGDGINSGSIVLLTVFVVIGFIFVLMAIFLGRRIREERRQKQELAFLSANLFDQGQIEMFNPDMPLDEQVDLLPYDRRWEFPRDKLRLGRTLGQGAFGRVVRAEAFGLDDDEESTTVAVKMLKERADLTQQKALMSELKIMIHLGRHLNIVNLLGAVTGGIAKGELLVMVEYCRFGNLRHFLLAHRDTYINQIDPQSGLVDSNIQSKPLVSKMCSDANYVNESVLHGITNPTYQATKGVRYVDLVHNSQDADADEVDTTYNDSGTDTGNGNFSRDSIRKPATSTTAKHRLVTTCDLLCYSFQVSRGMEYLAQRKLIHRDLAARNVLLAEENVVKICDFGLAKDCYKYDNYVKKGDGPLPIKWMAIESIRDKVFTIKSDVWSFAVLTWEFFTLGGNPYPGVEIDEEFYKRLKNGYRMDKPDYCPDSFYQLITRCWSPEPKDRPDFTELSDILGNLLEASVRQHYLDLNTPYQEMNATLFETDDYLDMDDQKAETSKEDDEVFQPDDYLSMSRPNSDPLTHYDPIGTIIRPVGDRPVPNNAMEEVPMIQLVSFSEDEPFYSNNNHKLAMERERVGSFLSTGGNDLPLLESNEYLRMNGLVNVNLNIDHHGANGINKINKTMIEVNDSCHRL